MSDLMTTIRKHFEQRLKLHNAAFGDNPKLRARIEFRLGSISENLNGMEMLCADADAKGRERKQAIPAKERAPKKTKKGKK